MLQRSSNAKKTKVYFAVFLLLFCSTIILQYMQGRRQRKMSGGDKTKKLKPIAQYTKI